MTGGRGINVTTAAASLAANMFSSGVGGEKARTAVLYGKRVRHAETAEAQWPS